MEFCIKCPQADCTQTKNVPTSYNHTFCKLVNFFLKGPKALLAENSTSATVQELHVKLDYDTLQASATK